MRWTGIRIRIRIRIGMEMGMEMKMGMKMEMKMGMKMGMKIMRLTAEEKWMEYEMLTTTTEKSLVKRMAPLMMR